MENTNSINQNISIINLENLPYDLVVNILIRLNYKDLINLSQVSKKLNFLANDELIWKMKLIRDIRSWNLIDGHSYPKNLFNTSDFQFDSSEIQSYKSIYLSCCPDIVIKKEILEKLAKFKEAHNKQAQISSSESENSNLNRDFSNSLTFSIANPLCVFSQVKDYIYRNVFSYQNENINRNLNDNETLPKIVMFGPGLETSTSCLVTNLLWKSEFKTIGMIPGKDGYGSGIKLRLFNHKPFNLTILYTNVSKVRNSNNHELESNKLIMSKTDQDTNQVTYELHPQVKEACLDASGFIYVIDNTQLALLERNEKKGINSSEKDPNENFVQELSVFTKETNSELPLLVLSCLANDQLQDLNKNINENSLSCFELVNKLKLYELNCQWQIRNCQIFKNKMKEIILGFEWILGKLN